MSEQQKEEGDAPEKPSKLPLIIGLALAVIGGGGGFYAAQSGMILGGESHEETTTIKEDVVLPKVAFVDVEPLTVSLPAPSPNQYLRFRANLEVPAQHEEEVSLLLPRVVDVMNSYLRALELSDLEDASALTRLRAQMLRRVQIVTGPGKVNDLLVMEFVLN